MNDQLGPLLLQAARETLHRYLQDKGLPEFDLAAYPPAAREPHGTFVTLKCHGELRGCIGTLNPQGPVLDEVVHNAVSAAVNDHRFRPVAFDELDQLTIEVSVLTTPVRLQAVGSAAILAALKPGVHGVIVHHRGCRSTYLPQVWHELEDKEVFLDSLCRKGGMPHGAWRSPDTEIYIYEAKVYGPIAAGGKECSAPDRTLF